MDKCKRNSQGFRGTIAASAGPFADQALFQASGNGVSLAHADLPVGPFFISTLSKSHGSNPANAGRGRVGFAT